MNGNLCLHKHVTCDYSNENTSWKIYLAGGIEFAENNGEDWRDKAARLLSSKIQLLDPTKFPTQGAYLTLTRNNPEYTCATEVFDRLIRQPCIEAVQLSNRILCYYDEAMRAGAGSFCELWEAYNCNIPIDLVNPKGFKLSQWLTTMNLSVHDNLEAACAFIHYELGIEY